MRRTALGTAVGVLAVLGFQAVANGAGTGIDKNDAKADTPGVYSSSAAHRAKGRSQVHKLALTDKGKGRPP